MAAQRKNERRVLGVLGGLGPMATVYFYELVTRHTAAKCDQEHIDMIISSRASTPDRSAFIMGKSTEDPFEVMEAEAKHLVEAGAQMLAIPCNTAHYFYTRLNDALPVPFFNMVELTCQKAKELGCQKLGILATEGTIYTETYQKACAHHGLECAVPSAEGQNKISTVIFRDIKSGSPPDMALFNAAAEELFAAGCQKLVLGCTELSLIKKEGLLDNRYLDSMDVLAEAVILACGKTPQGFAWQ